MTKKTHSFHSESSQSDLSLDNISQEKINIVSNIFALKYTYHLLISL